MSANTKITAFQYELQYSYENDFEPPLRSLMLNIFNS